MPSFVVQQSRSRGSMVRISNVDWVAESESTHGKVMTGLFKVLTCVAISGCSTLSDWANPNVDVAIDHPPGIGLNVTGIAFAPANGPCGKQVIGNLEPKLRAMDIAVSTDVASVAEARRIGSRRGAIERSGDVSPGGAIASILPDSYLKETGNEREEPEAASAAQLLLVSLRDRVCDSNFRQGQTQTVHKKTEKRIVDGEEVEIEEEYTETEFTSTTSFEFNVSVQATDVNTDRYVDSKSIMLHRTRSNRSKSSWPSYPSAAPLRISASNEASQELERWLGPWTETVRLVFYDVEECGMGRAYSNLQQGLRTFALEAALDSVNSCDDPEIAPQFLAAAHYNVGLLYFIDGEHEAALRTLLTAQSIDPTNGAVTRALGQLRRAIALMEKSHRIEGLPQRRTNSDTPLDYPGAPPAF